MFGTHHIVHDRSMRAGEALIGFAQVRVSIDVQDADFVVFADRTDQTLRRRMIASDNGGNFSFAEDISFAVGRKPNRSTQHRFD